MANRSTPTQQTYASGTSGIIDKKRIQDLVKEVDPMEQLDEDVEEVVIHVNLTGQNDFSSNVKQFNYIGLFNILYRRCFCKSRMIS